MWCLTAALLMTQFGHRQSAQAAATKSCAKGGVCKLGDRGPGGGIVFHVAPTVSWWGEYIEAFARPVGGSPRTWGDSIVHQGDDAQAQRILGKQVGAGQLNTRRLRALDASWAAFATSWAVPLKDEWAVPSKDELDLLYNYIATTPSPLSAAHAIGLKGNPYWTSSEASGTFAWYQLFQDGTQFTDANGIIRGLPGNKTLGRSSKHTGSEFRPQRLRWVLVRTFSRADTTLPARAPIPEIPQGGRESSSCALGISCELGDLGPGGGLVFYDAGSTQSWGRWLEATPAACEAAGLRWRAAAPGKSGTRQLPLAYPVWKTAARQRVESKRLGMGKANTEVILQQHRSLAPGDRVATAAGYADALECGGKDDWFLPSKDELDSLYNLLALTNHDLTGTNSFGFERGYYWTSSEYNNENAWTQYWIDGQQFDREKWLSANEQRRKGGAEDPRPFRVRPIRAFG